MSKELEKTTSAKRPKWPRIVIGLILIVVGLVIMMPWILANTSLRNQLLGALVKDPSVSISSEGASFGYFSPTSIQGLEIDVDQGQSNIKIEEIKTSKSWLAMLMERPQLGEFTFLKPVVVVTVDGSEIDDGEDGDGNLDEGTNGDAPSDTKQTGRSDAKPAPPQFTAVIEDASIVVKNEGDDEPAIDIENVNITVHIDEEDAGSVLIIDPIVVFDRQEVTPDLCEQGLHLVAPLLAEHVEADGEFSFQIDKFRLPLNEEDEDEAARKIEIAGQVDLHRASVGLKDSIATRLIRMAANIGGGEIPDRINVVEETQVVFHVVDGRVHHEGFAFVLPQKDSSILVSSSGSVGLDRTIDLLVELALPEEGLGDSKLAELLSSEPIRLQVIGTIDEPEIKLAQNEAWIGKVESLIEAAEGGGDESELIGRTVDLLGEVLKNRPDDGEPLFPNLRDRMRDRRERRRQR